MSTLWDDITGVCPSCGSSKFFRVIKALELVNLNKEVDGGVSEELIKEETVDYIDDTLKCYNCERVIDMNRVITPSEWKEKKKVLSLLKEVKGERDSQLTESEIEADRNAENKSSLP